MNSPHLCDPLPPRCVLPLWHEKYSTGGVGRRGFILLVVGEHLPDLVVREVGPHSLSPTILIQERAGRAAVVFDESIGTFVVGARIEREWPIQRIPFLKLSWRHLPVFSSTSRELNWSRLATLCDFW